MFQRDHPADSVKDRCGASTITAPSTHDPKTIAVPPCVTKEVKLAASITPEKTLKVTNNTDDIQNKSVQPLSDVKSGKCTGARVRQTGYDVL